MQADGTFEKKFCMLPLWHAPLNPRDDPNTHKPADCTVSDAFISEDGCLLPCRCVHHLFTASPPRPQPPGSHLPVSPPSSRRTCMDPVYQHETTARSHCACLTRCIAIASAGSRQACRYSSKPLLNLPHHVCFLQGVQSLPHTGQHDCTNIVCVVVSHYVLYKHMQVHACRHHCFTLMVAIL